MLQRSGLLVQLLNFAVLGAMDCVQTEGNRPLFNKDGWDLGFEDAKITRCPPPPPKNYLLRHLRMRSIS